MSRLSFERLLELYRGIDFDVQGDEGLLTLSTPERLATLSLIGSDDAAADDAGLAVLEDSTTLAVGRVVRVRVGQPRVGLGILARTLDDLLRAPRARTEEPSDYFVVDGRFDAHTAPPLPMVTAYRKVLELVALLGRVAAFLDQTRQELVFVHEGKVVVPVRYDVEALGRTSLAAIDALLENFKDDVHLDQKLAILETAIVQMVEPVPVARRFIHLLNNLDSVTETLRQGYRLFASSFSYSKIRGEVEAARVDYVVKIHKTLIDIQGQLLGIPVATIIVTAQLKVSQDCDIGFWTNIAVLAGAWVFLVLLLIAIVNQWVTLGAINDDVEAQRSRLEKEYEAVGEQFVKIFTGLTRRVVWHRGALILIAAIAVVGALFASYAFVRLTASPMTCLSAMLPSAAATMVKPPAHRSTEPNQAPLSNGAEVP